MFNIESTLSNMIVLIASHIGSAERLVTLKEALVSVRQNNQLPDKIYISISTGIDVDLKEHIIEWTKQVSPIELDVHISSTKWYQFEHYRYMASKINPSDYIMFLDDDDRYLPSKIKWCDKMSGGRKLMVQHYYTKWYMPEDLQDASSDDQEYVCLSMPAHVLQKFFTLHKKIEPCTDLVFGEYCHESARIPCVYTQYVLYLQRVDSKISKDYDPNIQQVALSDMLNFSLNDISYE